MALGGGMMKRRHFLYAAGLGTVAGLTGLGAGFNPAFARAGRTVTQICDDFLDAYVAINPTLVGKVFGLERNSVAISDWSPAGAEKAAALMRGTLAELATTPPVNRKEELGAAFLEDTARSILAGIDAGEPYRKMSTHIFIGPPALLLTSFEQMSQGQGGDVPVSADIRDRDWSNILHRLQAVPAAMAGYRQSLELGLVRNLPAPRSMTLAVAKQCSGWASQGWFAKFASRYPGGALAGPLATAAANADRSYGELGQWLAQSYAPKASPADGIGSERYLLYTDLWLGLRTLDLDEAYGWAVEEFHRLEAEKTKESGRIRAGASFEDIRQQLDGDPKQSLAVTPFRDWAQAEVDRAIGKLGETEFDIPPQLRTCTVQMTEAGSGAMPFYVAPSEDFSTPGAVVWPTLGKTELPTWSANSTIYHESVPGHHIQIGGSRLLDLVRLQRVAGAAGHAEGWALYAERLMDELGWFDTPQKRLGFLSMQSFRAARVFVDIGLHTGRKIPAGMAGAGQPWTAASAIPLIDRASGLGRDAAAMEVERYYGWPAQACAYKLGERVWLDCRADAMAKAGPAFNRRKWHADALAMGPLGLDTLKQQLAKI